MSPYPPRELQRIFNVTGSLYFNTLDIAEPKTEAEEIAIEKEFNKRSSEMKILDEAIVNHTSLSEWPTQALKLLSDIEKRIATN